jgi:lysozyme
MDHDKLIDQLVLHEGIRLKPYLCTAGFQTLGVGRNLDALGISEEEAFILLGNDIDRCCHALDQLAEWWRDLDDVRQRVLVDMCFNLGPSRLMKFKKMWAAITKQAWDVAADEMLDSRWADQVGGRARTLADMMRTGQD